MNTNICFFSTNSTPINQFNQLMNMSDRQNNKMSFDQQELHKQVLKRNRLAASKCRQKKKEWIDGLICKANRMSSENQRLCLLNIQLKEEVLYLKTQLLMYKEYTSHVHTIRFGAV
ncbi:hypothetical protein EDC94DRAFT_597250 [Helicostylum pulchrum]|nr:hypothetical protein EDC94DRAFT_597250 [Helicostylum pulchrum]